MNEYTLTIKKCKQDDCSCYYKHRNESRQSYFKRIKVINISNPIYWKRINSRLEKLSKPVCNITYRKCICNKNTCVNIRSNETKFEYFDRLSKIYPFEIRRKE